VNMNYFKFEKGVHDFPFYNNNPPLSNKSWNILCIILILSILYTIITHKVLPTIITSSLILIYLLWSSNWNYKIVLHKPTSEEIIFLIVLIIIKVSFVCWIITISNYTSFVSSVPLISFGNLISFAWDALIDDVILFIVMLLSMKLIYQYSKNRKSAIILSSIITIGIYGTLYLSLNLNILSIFLVLYRYLGFTFDIFAYIKTKNLAICFLLHYVSRILLFMMLI